jgi:hypothetical protein
MAGNPLSHLSHNTMYFRDLLRENGTRKKIPEMMEMVVLVAENFFIVIEHRGPMRMIRNIEGF